MLLFCPLKFKNVTIMKFKIYLNRDFFDKILGSYYPVFDNISLHVISRHLHFEEYRVISYYDCSFVVSPFSLESGYIEVFRFTVKVDTRCIRIINMSYVIDSDFMISDVKYFPVTAVWLLPATNYEKWLNRCKLSLRVYRKYDFI